jgi:ubiquinone/menaquinone biosynthesis C-methylase UbiE
MPQAKARSGLAAEPTAALLLDRRARHLHDVCLATGLRLRDRWTLLSPCGGHKIHAALFIPNKVGSESDPALPRRIKTPEVSYTRLVDRFYLPENPGPELASALFDLIAEDYDRLTTLEVNRETAKILLSAVAPSVREIHCPIRILDFGCGSGVAVDAARRLEITSDLRFELVGTDISPAMIELARCRGEAIMSIDHWRAQPAASWDGVISAFVLHYDVPHQDLARIARQLRPGGRFAANYFKAATGRVDELTSMLAMHGLQLERVQQIATTSSENPMLVFNKATTGPRW